ncbi:MAG: thiol peroxidase [Gammaproteobacteria bacterium]|nr:thiol peroxidase [Gammaproteobacteria bacterium]MDH4253816.1 thiol peroxidase [Gammaproteobacteria bacterium]MDH5311792.1 thiol peroxidase [Gammaproteobacteria bacterium]
MHKIRFEGRSYETYGELPDVGSRAPDVSLVNTRLQDVSLANWLGLRKVIFSFPSIDVTSCAAAVATFDRIAEDHDDVVTLMVSCDLPFAHRRYLELNSFDHVIALSAIRHAGFGENYGVQIVEGPLKGMFASAVIVLDENNTVVHREQIEDVTATPDYLAAYQALGIAVDPDVLR